MYQDDDEPYKPKCEMCGDGGLMTIGAGQVTICGCDAGTAREKAMGRRSPERIKRILVLLGELWEAKPDLRLIQLLHGKTSAFRNGNDGFYFEDDKLEADLIAELKQLCNP